MRNLTLSAKLIGGFMVMGVMLLVGGFVKFFCARFSGSGYLLSALSFASCFLCVSLYFQS